MSLKDAVEQERAEETIIIHFTNAASRSKYEQLFLPFLCLGDGWLELNVWWP